MLHVCTALALFSPRVVARWLGSRRCSIVVGSRGVFSAIHRELHYT